MIVVKYGFYIKLIEGRYVRRHEGNAHLSFYLRTDNRGKHGQKGI
jgi:hypothetical protein